ncbi:MAG: hypothetical protein IIW50_04540 [Alistipes sp.]|nr:hypothetical protein [Alistipes sp.]
MGTNPQEKDPQTSEASASTTTTEISSPEYVDIPTDFTKTKTAAQSANQAFSEKLTELFKAREKAREKRKRTAEKVAVGHALGDLFGALGAHFVSGIDNSQAVVAQPLAPKSYEKVQSLINEGVADQNTFDQYMLSLTQKEGEQKVAIAQAEDKAAIAAAEEKNRQITEAAKLQAKREAEERERAFKESEGKKNRESNETVAGIRAAASGNKGSKDKDTLTTWQRIMALAIAPKDKVTTTVESGGMGLGDITRTTTSAYEPSESDMKNLYAKATTLAEKWGIPLDEKGAKEFRRWSALIGKKTKNGRLITEEGITALKNAGKTISQIEAEIQ